ncbi:MAG: J domain-containing protein [Campylobacterota bacterium]|nr:J domain-containing protein [Campylobacterota bacterium]
MYDIKGYYALLNVSRGASLRQIKLAYRKKAKEIHPDKNTDVDTTKMFQRLNEAYEVLGNDIKRKNYDNNISAEINYKIFDEEVSETDFIKFSTNINTLQCNCKDWLKNRNKFPTYDPRRLCKHLVARFTIKTVDHNKNILTLDIPDELKPFERYIIDRKLSFKGVKLFQEIVFLKSSIVVIDYYETHLYLYLKKSSDTFCSYQVFEVHKYKGVGYKWMHQDDTEVVYKDNIDGKDYINKRFNVINSNVALCNNLYKKHIDDEERARELAKYQTTSELLKKIVSNYSTLSFNKKLKKMGYIKKSVDNKNWILDGKGFNYAIDVKKYSTGMATQIKWRVDKFVELLREMDEYIIISEKKSPTKKRQKSPKQIIREEWLKDVSCPKCYSKNIHKKDKRQRKSFQVQRYQCIDCKSIFQEKINDIPSEPNNIKTSDDILKKPISDFNITHNNDINMNMSNFDKIINFFRRENNAKTK